MRRLEPGELRRAGYDLGQGYQAPNAEDLRRRLIWSHGAERAAQIIAGHAGKANADLARWRALGDAPDAP